MIAGRFAARSFLFALLLTSWLAPSLFAQTEVHLRVETKSFTRIPVELKTCLLKEGATAVMGQSVMETLNRDLWLSSRIVGYQTAEIARAAEGLLTSADPTFPNEPIRLAVETSLSLRQNKITLEGEIIDRKTQRSVEKKRYAGCEATLRLLVHSLADDIVKSLTGENGIAKTRIVYSAAMPFGKELYVMDYDGANQQQLTTDRNLNITPAWFANARDVIYTSYLRKNPDFFVLDILTGKTMPLLTGNGLYSAPASSPDGRNIAFVSTKDGNAEIYVMGANGSNIRRLTQHPAIDSSPSWSPSGREIVFTSDRLGNPQLFLMDAEGSNVRRLPIESDYNDSPAWSPRGDKIAFVARGPAGFDIFCYDLPTAAATQLTANAGTNEDPRWSPDGYRLAFSSTRDGSGNIYSMLWDGSDVRQLTFKGRCSSPNWSLNLRPEEDFNCKD